MCVRSELCECVCMSVCYVSMCICLYECVGLNVCVSACICVCMSKCVCVKSELCECVYVCMSECVFECLYENDYISM